MGFYSKSRRTLIAAALALGACVLLAPWYSAHVLETRLRTWVREIQGDPYAVRIRHWDHHAGWLASHGALDMEWKPPCLEESGGPFGVRVTYHAHQVPDAQGWMRIDVAMEPLLPSAADAGPHATLPRTTAVAHQGFDGLVRAGFSLPEWTLATRWGPVRLAPSQAQLELGDSRVRVSWAGPQLAVEQGASAARAHGLRVQMDWDEQAPSRGHAVFEVDDLQGASLHVQGLRLDADAAQQDDRISASLKQVARKVGYEAYALDDQELQLQLTDLHLPSALALGQALAARCTPTDGAAAQAQAVRTALHTLLVSGLSVGVPVVKGRVAHSDWQGQFALSLGPAPSGRVQVAQQLSAQAGLQVRGEVSSLDASVLPVPAGAYWEPRADGYATAWRYAQGQLQVNGQPQDSARLQWLIDVLDKGLAAWLLHPEAEPVPPHEPLVPPTELPESPPHPG